MTLNYQSATLTVPVVQVPSQGMVIQIGINIST